MLTYQPPKSTVFVFVLSLAWLAAACSPGAPAPAAEAAVPHLEALVSAAATGSSEDLLDLVQLSQLPCTTVEGLGGPPKCQAGEAEGTLVEVLPVLGPEGHHMRRTELSSWTGIDGAQLYAAFRTSESVYSDEFYPAGEYGVAFLLPDEANVVVFQVTQDGIVRLDYHVPQTIDDLLEQSEVILGPASPLY
jgi:hypothetical protein